MNKVVTSGLILFVINTALKKLGNLKLIFFTQFWLTIINSLALLYIIVEKF